MAIKFFRSPFIEGKVRQNSFCQRLKSEIADKTSKVANLRPKLCPSESVHIAIPVAKLQGIKCFAPGNKFRINRVEQIGCVLAVARTVAAPGTSPAAR